MKLYAGVDLHCNNNYLGIIDEDGNRIFRKKLPNDINAIRNTLKPFHKDMEGIVV
ncbi:MAG TPA: IS110 family transposase, partial [Nitrospirae bacterium]|nr:IS110 family transposase [Nitrospirota bacterium]HDZ00633.1 IS110 family transposase [Nitrospirota bacterium]HDZ01905.1 IS110 family transposase [Nitrospirota bacterium]